ncbi:MAG TPA: hypothetical protein PLU16_05525 [Gallionellaceae bacterium]|jgi:hypothetical protein|nr:MAG: hypothetical protein B7Y04_04440 [Gallionellales bacterium 24-53-125]HQS57164.1 hypothetical protein [Gallionellaceae bacterium]HQS74648.1 hypothetical protein [Gallionellaceae bacterium]
MLNLRFIQPVFFAFVLLLAQQGGILHALQHVLAEQSQQQQDKQTPHSNACEQCTSYSQLGNALNSSHLTFDLLASLTQELAQHHVAVHAQQTLTATARGPPSLQRST